MDSHAFRHQGQADQEEERQGEHLDRRVSLDERRPVTESIMMMTATTMADDHDLHAAGQATAVMTESSEKM